MYKNIIIAFIVGLILFVFGAGTSYFMLKEKTCNLKIDPNNTYEAGWEAAKKRLIETGYLQSFEATAKIMTLTGDVVKKNNNSIDLKIIPLEPLADPDLNIRVVEINKETKIYQIVEKDQAKYEEELAKYLAEFSDNSYINGPKAPLVPNRYKQAEALLSDITTGQVVSIKTAEDIKDKKRFLATEITIRPR